MKKTAMFSLGEKVAARGAYPGQTGLALQSYAPITRRRAKLTPEEEEQVDRNLGNVIPKVFKSKATPIPELLSSPVWAAGAGGVAGGAAGALAGSALGATGGHPYSGAALGGGLGSLIAAVLAYKLKDAKNQGLIETLRRSPRGATIRDMEADPVYQAERERQARLMAAVASARAGRQ